MRLAVLAQLVGLALIVYGAYLIAGLGWSFVVAGVLTVVAGAFHEAAVS